MTALTELKIKKGKKRCMNQSTVDSFSMNFEDMVGMHGILGLFCKLEPERGQLLNHKQLNLVNESFLWLIPNEH